MTWPEVKLPAAPAPTYSHGSYGHRQQFPVSSRVLSPATPFGVNTKCPPELIAPDPRSSTVSIAISEDPTDEDDDSEDIHLEQSVSFQRQAKTVFQYSFPEKTDTLAIVTTEDMFLPDPGPSHSAAIPGTLLPPSVFAPPVPAFHEDEFFVPEPISDDIEDFFPSSTTAASAVDSTLGDDNDVNEEKELSLQKPVALLVDLSRSKCPTLVKDDRIYAQVEPLTTSCFANDVSLGLASVKDPTVAGEDDSIAGSYSSGSQFSIDSVAANTLCYSDHLLLHQTVFAVDPENEDQDNVYEYNRAHLEKSVSAVIKESKAKKMVTVIEFGQTRDGIADYIAPSSTATSPAVSDPFAEDASSSTMTRSASVSTRTPGIYRKSTRSSSLKSVTNFTRNTFGAVNIGRFDKLKVSTIHSPDKLATKKNIKAAKENLLVGTKTRRRRL